MSLHPTGGPGKGDEGNVELRNILNIFLAMKDIAALTLWEARIQPKELYVQHPDKKLLRVMFAGLYTEVRL